MQPRAESPRAPFRTTHPEGAARAGEIGRDRAHRASSGPWRAALLLLLVASCRSAPRPQEYLEIGFASPEQTLRTFQLAGRADLPGLEFRCLAVEFVRGHRLSELAYREFRDGAGWLRAGIARAGLVEVREVGPGRATALLSVRLPLGTLRRDFEVDLVRETFWEAFSGERRLMDELGLDLGSLLAVVDGPMGPLLVARLELPPHLDPREGADPITGIRVGQEWKIADIRPVEPGKSPPAPAPDP